MRFNPRTIHFTGPFNKKKDRHEWRTGGVVGITCAQWAGLMDVVLEYRKTDTNDSSPDARSYDAEQNAIVNKIIGWLEAGPQPFDKTKQGHYRSRGDETVLLLDGYHEISQLLTQASLHFHNIIDDKAEDFDILNRRESERKVLPADLFATKVCFEAVEKLVKENNTGYYNEEDKPISKRSAFSIKRRRDEILRDKKFRLSMKEMFAQMDAKRKGETYVAPPPPPERVAPAKPVYVKPEQRPTGPMYDLPTPKVQIGDKLRLSFGKGPEIAYYKKLLVRAKLKQLRAFYRGWAVEDAKYRKPMKINDGNKNQIREMLRVIENAYEIEVAGVIARPSQPGVSNQCYVGGGSGWSGLSYGCALLFRAEQPNNQPDREPNQVQFLMHEFTVPDYHVARYLMDNPALVVEEQAA